MKIVGCLALAAAGGQIAMAVPELDLVLGFWGGNYSDPSTFTAQDVYTAEWIFPAVDDKK